MLTENQIETVEWLRERPVEIGWLLGFDKLTEMHNEWIKDMLSGEEDETLQGHRGSYKTTCLSVALFCIIIAMPNLKTLFMRKTDTDVKEIVEQVTKMIKSDVARYISKRIWGVEVKLTKESANEIDTNLSNDPRGTSQLVAIGIGSSITGKHFDFIFTDDIVNKEDKYSRAERERTKRAYDELQNVINRGGRIFNTGTPWHKEDAFTKMPNPKKYDCYSTGLMTTEEIEKKRTDLPPDLFAANYELRHIASDKVIFTPKKPEAEAHNVEQGRCHIDASYGGADYTAFTICKKKDGVYYVLGKLWQKHVDDVEDDIISMRKAANAGRISCEDNGDKGYLAKDLRQRGEKTHVYHENMNKYLKITSYLKAAWDKVVFVEGTDEEYIRQICDYTEDAEHDDAPDSLASMIRELWRQNDQQQGGLYLI